MRVCILVSAISPLLDPPAAKGHNVADLFNRLLKVLVDLVVGQPEHGETAEDQLVIAVAILHERVAISMTGEAVDLDDEFSLLPGEVELWARRRGW